MKSFIRATFYFFHFKPTMTIVDDTNLAYLLSLGFEIDLCKQALIQNSTLENATEW